MQKIVQHNQKCAFKCFVFAHKLVNNITLRLRHFASICSEHNSLLFSATHSSHVLCNKKQGLHLSQRLQMVVVYCLPPGHVTSFHKWTKILAAFFWLSLWSKRLMVSRTSRFYCTVWTLLPTKNKINKSQQRCRGLTFVVKFKMNKMVLNSLYNNSD